MEKKAIQGWVAAQFQQRGVQAEPEACALLVQLVGAEDLHALAAEIDKLSTWAAGEPIGEREVELLSAAVADVPIFGSRTRGRVATRLGRSRRVRRSSSASPRRAATRQPDSRARSEAI